MKGKKCAEQNILRAQLWLPYIISTDWTEIGTTGNYVIAYFTQSFPLGYCNVLSYFQENKLNEKLWFHSRLEWILAGHYRLLWSTSDSEVLCLLLYSILSRRHKHPSCIHSLHKQLEQESVVCVRLFTSFIFYYPNMPTHGKSEL